MRVEHSTRWTLTITKDGRIRVRTDRRWTWTVDDVTND